MLCKHCSSKNLVKKGFTKLKKQKFFCKNCERNQLKTDDRQKYDDKIIQTAMILFSEGNNYRRTARILSKIFQKKIYYQTIIKWVKKKVAQLPENTEENKEKRDIAIIEMDELYTYIKKNLKTGDSKQEYGLLLTATTCVCLHFT
jgi:insertion element IS1 protein InsB